MTRLICSFAIVAISWGACLAEVDFSPTCNSPQSIGPIQVVPGSNRYSAVAWNGREYGVLFINGFGEARFQRTYADGTAAAPSVLVAAGVQIQRVDLVWTGQEYGAVYTNFVNSVWSIQFVRLNTNGVVIGGPTRVNYAGTTPLQYAYLPSLATSGNGFAVAWADYRNGALDTFVTLLGASGNVTFSDLAVITGPNDQTEPTIAWSRLGNRYILAVQDFRGGVRNEISDAYLFESGGFSYGGIVVTGSGSSFAPRLAEGGSGMGLVWYDTRDGNTEIYFGTLSLTGSKYGTDARLTNDAATSTVPLVRWTGAEYGVLFWDTRDGVYDVFFQRVTADGSPLGANVRVSYGADVFYTALAFGTRGYMIAYGAGSGLALQPWGCAFPSLPGCPEGIDAYGISGTSATLAWLPAYDSSTDIAYYQVFRNAALVGTTSSTFFNDTGLSPGVTYQYNVRSVNAAQLFSTPCPNAQLYVKSSAALSLSVDKSGNDIDLSWNAAGQSTYRVMRGTSPQVMSQIQSTPDTVATDANAALGTVCYFYSIDEPPAPAPAP